MKKPVLNDGLFHGGSCACNGARDLSDQIGAVALGIQHVAGQTDAQHGQDNAGHGGPDQDVGGQSETGHRFFSSSFLDSDCAVWKATTRSPIWSKSKRSWLRRLTVTQTSMLTPK